MDRLINIGFGNCVDAQKVIAVVDPDAAPIRRMVQNAKELHQCIDATQGRRTKAVIVMENQMVVLSALVPDTIGKRFASVKDNGGDLV